MIREWAVDDDLWVRRTAIRSQLGSKATTDRGLLDHTLGSKLEDSLHGREFFIRKAVGVGAARARQDGPGMGARLGRRARQQHVRAVPPRGAQALGMSRSGGVRTVGPSRRTSPS